MKEEEEDVDEKGGRPKEKGDSVMKVKRTKSRIRMLQQVHTAIVTRSL